MWIVGNDTVNEASQSYPEPVEGDFCVLWRTGREKPSFDKPGMLSRFARLSNLYLVSP